jgi:hypothetical protein
LTNETFFVRNFKVGNFSEPNKLHFLFQYEILTKGWHADKKIFFLTGSHNFSCTWLKETIFRR